MPDFLLAIEIEGGIYSFGRHTRGSGFSKDMEKYNSLALHGISLLRYTPKQIKNGDFANDIEVFIKNFIFN